MKRYIHAYINDNILRACFSRHAGGDLHWEILIGFISLEKIDLAECAYDSVGKYCAEMM